MENRNDRREAHTLSMPGAGPVSAQGRHGLQLFDREQLTVTGVTAVESYDDRQIVMETQMGTLTLKGEDLNIKQLDLESGRFAVEGYVNSLVYATTRAGKARQGRTRSFLERLLR
ncbi:MAG TPA: sporulation protein YabP [Symbiobacteriaceae bacterium]|nr:sporulation protein YabP [Symbiobacteriaceae bacterium]